MKMTTPIRPTMPAISPAATESAPRLGPTVRSSRIVSEAGSAPERSRIARLFASSTVKSPEICPVPPRIGSWMTGAEMTLPSSTMANGRPTFSDVTSPNRRAPEELNRKVTIGSLVR